MFKMTNLTQKTLSALMTRGILEKKHASACSHEFILIHLTGVYIISKQQNTLNYTIDILRI